MLGTLNFTVFNVEPNYVVVRLDVYNRVSQQVTKPDLCVLIKVLVVCHPRQCSGRVREAAFPQMAMCPPLPSLTLQAHLKIRSAWFPSRSEAGAAVRAATELPLFWRIVIIIVACHSFAGVWGRH